MDKLIFIPLIACMLILFSNTVKAEPSAGGTADGTPFDIPYGTPINLETAKKLTAAVEAKALKHDWKLNIAIVDPNGDLIHFTRMDGSQLASIGISQAKARTAARFRRETRVFFNALESGRSFIATLDPTMVASPGGLPLIKDGKLIGAIGCSGGTGEQDDIACKVAVDLIK